jgi:hypothetical protein
MTSGQPRRPSLTGFLLPSLVRTVPISIPSNVEGRSNFLVVIIIFVSHTDNSTSLPLYLDRDF